MAPFRYRINDTPQPFTIISNHGSEVVMDWLASKEKDEATQIPSLVIQVKNLDQPDNGYYSTSVYALRRRDRERQRCGLPPYWEPLAHELEVNRDAFLRRATSKAEEALGH